MTVTITNDQGIIVKDSPNNTNEERVGTIYAFGTNNTNPKSTDDVSLQAITVTQAAGAGFKIMNIDLEFDYTTSRDGTRATSFFKIGFIESRITITSNGNTYTKESLIPSTISHLLQ